MLLYNASFSITMLANLTRLHQHDKIKTHHYTPRKPLKQNTFTLNKKEMN